MKKFFVICLLCLLNIYLAWGAATNNVTTYTIFLTDASGKYLETPTDFSESDVKQFSAKLTWKGQVVTIAPGATDPQACFMLQKNPSGTAKYIILRVTLQRFSGTIPLQEDDPVGSIVKVSITTSDGYTKEEDVPRTTANSVQRILIDVTPPATPPSLAIGGQLCPGGASTSITISDLADFTGWTVSVVEGGDFTISTPVQANMTISAGAGVAAGNYTVALTKGSETYTQTLTVGAVPNLTIAATNTNNGNGYFCTGGDADYKTSVRLTASGANGYTYTWTKPDKSTATGAALDGVKVAGEYTVEATKTGECPAEKKITVEELAAPAAPEIQVPDPVHVCTKDGGTTTLELNNKVSGYTYEWKNTSGIASNTVAHSLIAATTAGTPITVQALDGKCKSAVSNSVVLYGHELKLALNPAGTQQVVASSVQTVTATPSFTPDNGTVIDAMSWNWTGTGDGIAAGTGTNEITTNPVTQTSTYKVTARDQYGCSATSATTTFEVKVGSVWNINLADISGCIGSAMTLTANTTGSTPAAPVSYTWTCADPKVTFGSPAGKATTVSATAPGSYTVNLVMQDGNKVTKTKDVTVTVFGRPTLNKVEVTSTDVCKGDQVTLLASGGAPAADVLGNSNTIHYIWTGATAVTGNETQAKATLATGNNNYSVKIRDGNNCESDSKNVTFVGHEVTVTPKINGSASAATVAYGSTVNLDCEVNYLPEPSTVKTYTWGPTSAINGDYQSKTAVSNALTTGGTFTIAVVDNNNCKAQNTISYGVTGTELKVTLTNVYLCAGAETPLRAQTTGGTGTAMDYTWISVDGRLAFDDVKAANPKVTTQTPGNYPVKVEITQGAQTVTSNEMTLTIGAQPSLQSMAFYKDNILIPNDGTTVLPGSVVQALVTPKNLPAGTKYSWTSTPDIIAEVSADHLTATSKALALGNNCMKLTVTNAEDKCPDEQEVCVMVAGTALTINMTDKTLCAGTATDIVTSGAVITGGTKPYTCAWSCDNAAFKYTPSDDNSTITVLATTPAGVYQVTLEVEDKKGNTASKTFQVTVNAMPAFLTAPASPLVARTGTTVNLVASVSPNTATVTWTGNPVTGAQTGTTGAASIEAGTFAAAGKYLYTVEAANGICKIDSTILVNVLDKVQDIVLTAGDVNICEGLEGVLNASATGGSGNLSCSWEVRQGDLQLSNLTDWNPTVVSGSVGKHTVRVTVKDNATDDPADPKYKDIVVTILAKPTINSLIADNLTTSEHGVTTVNYGDELKLIATVDPASVTCTWTELYTDLNSTTGTEVQTKPMRQTNTFTVTADTKGCTASKDITVVVKQPEAGAVLSMSLERKCADSGESMMLTLSATGATSYSFTLKNNAGQSWNFTGAGPWQHPIPLNEQDTYYVQDFKAFKNGLEITDTHVPDEIEALFYTTPVITIDGGNVQKVCKGDALTLTANSQLGGTKYVWDDGSIENGVPFVPEASGVYTVTATSDKGCSSTSEVSVSLIDKPVITINASPKVICLGDAVTLTAGGANEYSWNNGGTGEEIEVIPNVGGTIKYVVSGRETVNGCSDTASVSIVVNEPPLIVDASKQIRNIAIGKNVTFGVKATGKDLTYEWSRWTGDSWLTLYNTSTDEPMVEGAQTDSLTLKNVPRSWNETQLRCVVRNGCGNDDTTFILNVKECFALADIEWNMCEGIRPETDPSVQIDGWYCPGTKIAVCARLIPEDPENEIENPVYKWTVDGLSTDDGRWGEMTFISDSSVLSWVPPIDWQDNITIALCAYADGACDTICKKYLRLKARNFAEVDWKLNTSIDPSRMFCSGDTVTFTISDPKHTAGKQPLYKWYNDIFDLQEEPSEYNEVISLENEKLVMAMGQKDSWVKVVMTPSPEICTREPYYVDTVFLKVKETVHPKLTVWCEDTLACLNDSIRFEARWEDAGENPSFKWTRSIGYPYWDLGTKNYAVSILDDKDMWIKCELKPSQEVCYNTDTIFSDVIQVKAIADPKVTITADLDGKVEGDEVIVESDITGMPIRNPRYTWYIDDMIAKDQESELIRSDLHQGDQIQLGVRGDRICQNQVLSNVLEINFESSARDTLIVIYVGETVRNVSLFRTGDESCEFFIAPDGYTGNAKVTMGVDGLFNYIPDRDFTGKEKITYKVVNRYTGRTEIGYIYIEVRGKEKYFIPNIITPNNDGLNDTWKLDFLTDFPDHVITVYNRNGKIVFRADNYQNDWDGTGKGNSGYVAYFNLSNGIYTYVIELGNKEILKGWLEIRRDMNPGKYSR